MHRGRVVALDERGAVWTTDQFRETFADMGPIKDCVVKMDQATGRSRGFGVKVDDRATPVLRDVSISCCRRAAIGVGSAGNLPTVEGVLRCQQSATESGRMKRTKTAPAAPPSARGVTSTSPKVKSTPPPVVAPSRGTRK